MNNKQTFEAAVETYVDNIRNNHVTYWRKQLSDSTLAERDTFTVNKGRKYIKVVRNTPSQKFVHSFIDKETGDIFKSSTWSSPAKHARGNIFVEGGLTALNFDGQVRYL